MDRLHLSAAQVLAAFLSHVKKGRKRARPPRRAAELLARQLSPDARAFLEVWAMHETPHVAIGELWLDDDDPGDAVPPPGDVDLKAEPRTEVIMFAHSPGGDLFALRQGEDEQFRAVVRIQHDYGWQEFEVAPDLASFVRQCLAEAKENGEETTLDRFLPTFTVVECPSAPPEPTPAPIPAAVTNVLPPVGASQVSASPNGRRFLVVSGAEASVVDAATGETRRLDRGGGYEHGGWIDERYVVLCRSWRSGSTDDPAEVALSATFTGVPEGLANQVRADDRVIVVDVDDDEPAARPRVYALDGNLVAAGEGVVVLRGRYGKNPPYTFLRLTADGLAEVTTVTKNLGAVYPVSGRWYGSNGFELVNLDAASSSWKSEVWPERARLTARPTDPVPDGAASRTPLTQSKGELSLKGARIMHDRQDDDDPLSTVSVTVDTPSWYQIPRGIFTHRVLVDRDAVTYTPAHRFIGDCHALLVVADGTQTWARTVPFPVTRLWRGSTDWVVTDDEGLVWSVHP